MTFLVLLGRPETGWVFPFLLLIPALFVNLFWKEKWERLDVTALYFTGAAYIQLIIGTIGPMILFLGEPHLATPVVFTTIYFFGLVGGLYALKISSRQAGVGLWALVAYSALLPVLLQAVKPFFLSCPSLPLRIVLAAALIAPLGFLAELPYIFLLNGFHGTRRGRAYTWENLGTLAGVPLGLWLQLSLGYSYAAWCGAVIYGLTQAVLAMRQRTATVAASAGQPAEGKTEDAEKIPSTIEGPCEVRAV